MRIFNNSIPSSFFIKKSQIVPEQVVLESVYVYEDAIPYIRCQIQSTIQHEAAHRADEEGRNRQILEHKQDIRDKTRPSANFQPHSASPQTDLGRSAQILMPFQQFVSETRAEPIAEREEEEEGMLLRNLMPLRRVISSPGRRRTAVAAGLVIGMSADWGADPGERTLARSVRATAAAATSAAFL
jgi:hypothetical protein